ncbi:MAG: 2-oxoacid:ferredoxin oxidoreductase subunit beta [Deltaproteobacteria bacterium]|nr:2-oxoacid:ferredoxin oxidoreductase subunit beta [Deltaproteobacteria bacterium]
MTEVVKLTKKDFQSDQEVRWCPGCGDYAILSAIQTVLPTLGVPKEKFVVVSGIGCSSRFPYYMDTYGFHGIHGRAPGIATGVKMARPDLQVWVATGDGDAMSIGGNHLIHLLRRNVGVKVVMFNNRIYGLTKGQYSPTSPVGKKTKSTPFGSVDTPFNPLALVLGAGASFVARSVDVFQPHLREVVAAAAAHEGSAFIEVYQNCNIFNDGAYTFMTDKPVRDEQGLTLEAGKPLVFGKGRDKGIRMNGTRLEVVALGDGVTEDDCIVWDPTEENPTLAFMLAQMLPPDFPTPIGIFRSVEQPAYEQVVAAQIEEQIEKTGKGTLEELIYSGELWSVAGDGSIKRG